MIRATLVCISVAALASVAEGIQHAGDAPSVSEPTPSLGETCQKIAASVSVKSNVYYDDSDNYWDDIRHWATSSTQVAACSFEPGTPEDVGIALQILGKTRSPFAVKGGGHATNQGFSSTEGVQIAMSRFSDIVYDHTAGTATIGAGMIWDDVYAALEQYEVNVVGARVSGVGVAGFILGGGYSWLSNQYGLAIDTVHAYEFIAPNGTVIDVTETSSPDLFFALKGGLNNFGVVTRFTLKTFPQTQVWGGIMFFTTDVLDPVLLDEIAQATVNFGANNKDPKAAIVTSFNYLNGLPVPSVILFYDAPTPPDGVFDEFLAISPLTETIATRPFPAFIQSLHQYSLTRVIFNSISVTGYPLSLLQVIANEAKSWAEKLWPLVPIINYDVELFIPDFLKHNQTPSAYPPDRKQALLPLEIYFSWDLPDADQDVYDAVRTTAETIRAHAVGDGQLVADAVVYPNYAIFDTPLVELYGANIPRLQAIKKAVDPDDVMGLTGGFKL